MAGIEKICEFSGEYPGWLMYGYKRNHIQIIPKYRKLFRGADAVLYVFKPEEYFVYKSGGCFQYTEDDFKRDLEYMPDYTGTYKDFIKEKHLKCKPRLQYNYMLKVSNQELQGEVKGEYFNYTFELKATIKRLKRMLHCRNLKVKYTDKTLYQYFDELT